IAALGGLPFPPRELVDQFAVGLTEKPPFTLAAKFEHPESIREGSAVLTITATRAEGFDGDIALTPVGLPANVTSSFKTVPKGMNEVKGDLKIAKAAALGDFPISFTGKAKHKEKEYSVIAPPLPLLVVLPFDLKVEPAPVKIETGEKAK